MLTRISTPSWGYIYIYVYKYAYIHIYIYIYTHIHRGIVWRHVDSRAAEAMTQDERSMLD